MSRNTTRPGLTRPLTTLGVALITASIATTAIAGVALAGKAAPTPFFGPDVECVDGGTAINPVVDLTFDGKGRWTRAEIKAVAFDKDSDTTWTGSTDVAERLDMRSWTTIQGVTVPAASGPFDVTFYVRPVDRKNTPLVEDWTTGTYTCP